ncbi:MAG: ParA family protein [Planctomycetota bacterium]
MAITVGFVSEKGGVGKTTACYHIAYGLHHHEDKRVLVVDTDYQRGGITCRIVPALLEHFRSGSLPGVTLYDKFQQLYSGVQLTPNVDIRNSPEGVDLMPADPRLSHVSVDKLPSTNNIRENNRRLWTHLKVLQVVLEPLQDEYDYILVDSHPELSDLLRTVVYASDFCVSPVKFDLQSTVGVPSAIQAMNEVNDDMQMIGQALGDTDGFTPTVFKGAMGMMAREWGSGLKNSEMRQYRRLERSCGVFESYITEGDGLRLASENRCSVHEIKGANAEKQSQQFRAMTREFIQRCTP